MNYYNKEIEEIKKALLTSENGLRDEEVIKRLNKYGKNIVPKKKKESIIKLFFSEFKDPIVILLLFTVLASFIANEIIDAVAILFIVLIDVIIGTYEENKANNIAESLTKLVSLKTKVIRNGNVIKIDSSNLVIGDCVLLESGDKINADLRIIESYNLEVDEAVLTGESINVSKNSETLKNDNISINEQKNMLFAGTNVVSGRGKAIVVGTAINTEFGKIAESINKNQEEKSPLTIRIEKFSKQISVLVIIVAIFLTILLISKNSSYNEIFLSVIALSVSVMPEGLPLALTMALTIGANKMAKKNVIVKKLNSVESLGSCTVIASDKTGTLTENIQTAKKILLPNNLEYDIYGNGYELKGKIIGENIEYAKEIATLGVINNEAYIDDGKLVGDSIDVAFLVLGKKLKVNSSNIKILKIIPYESVKKYSAIFYEKDNEIYCTVKGTFEVVRKFCNKINLNNNKINLNFLDTQNEQLTKKGYRVISIANGKLRKKDNFTEQDINNLNFMGMVGFTDPIRKEVISSIKECKMAGIKVLMITGDHPLTSFAVAKELELVDDYNLVTTGSEIDDYFSKGINIFDDFIKSKTIFTRVTPLQKLEIVESLKRSGEFVAVTGDGVNDAPALRSANIGVSMGSGTDIAREVSDMIIIDDNFKSIVKGIKEGRCAYANIRKIIYFLISCGLSEVLFFGLSILFDLPMPMVAIQLLWLNIVTDGIQDLALSFEKAEKNIMKEKPRSPEEPLFDKILLSEIIFSGFFIGIIVFIVWIYLLKILNMDVVVARGYILALMVFIQNIHVFNCRSEKKSVLDIPIQSNYWVFYGVILSILLEFIVMKVPFLSMLLQTNKIPLLHIVVLFIISLSVLLFVEIYKKIKYKNI